MLQASTRILPHVLLPLEAVRVSSATWDQFETSQWVSGASMRDTGLIGAWEECHVCSVRI
jgi:hypothetical protein